ncbi:hypothetical protein ACFV19_24280 [Streptomyces griseoluteus]|uniref:hypothetical protein n=1 Tax=Streptomyces griseoluteus TaxID=29306 RepID=UPI0036B5B691
MTTKVFRSSTKAIETGRAAVEEGSLADDGAVGAVVINATLKLVWGCHFIPPGSRCAKRGGSSCQEEPTPARRQARQHRHSHRQGNLGAQQNPQSRRARQTASAGSLPTATRQSSAAEGLADSPRADIDHRA